MIYTGKFDAEIWILERQIKIMRLRKSLYELALKMEFNERSAQRLAEGTLFGCNSNYMASGRGLEEKDTEQINAIYSHIQALIHEINRIRITGNT
jgi:hypothetical protein